MDNLLAYFAAHAPMVFHGGNEYTDPKVMQTACQKKFDYAEAMLAEYNRRCPPKDYADVLREQSGLADAIAKQVTPLGNLFDGG